MTQPSPKPKRPSSIASVALRLLSTSFLLWLPLIGWELGERWAASGLDRRDLPPSEWSTPPLHESGPGATAALPALQPERPVPGSLQVGDAASDRLPAAMPPPSSVSTHALRSTLLPQNAETGPFRGEALREASPFLLTTLRGAAGLGGEINLTTIKETLMPVAARAERQQWRSSGDPLSPLPRHWRDELRRELGKGSKLLQAEVVRIPAPHVKSAEEIPLAIHGNGQADSLVPSPSAQSQQIVETWARRQTPLKEGEFRAVVVTLEPIELSSQAPPAPKPAWVSKADSAPPPGRGGAVRAVVVTSAPVELSTQPPPALEPDWIPAADSAPSPP